MNYAARNKDLKVRLESSSGGIFSLITEQWIKDGGKVYGAAYVDDEVKHILIYKVEDLWKIRGSKYVKSDFDPPNNCLISGTPCQMTDADFKVDVVCFGTPTKKSFKDYFKGADVCFRDKSKGWKNYHIKINDKLEPFRENEYMQKFLSKEILEKRCLTCKMSRRGDITLGDYWGIEHIHPELDDDLGCSIVMINTQKGQEMFEKIKDKMDYIETNIEDAIKYNPNIRR
jgi:coenzyme F420-reducing hydrogenase beta subunit